MSSLTEAEFSERIDASPYLRSIWSQSSLDFEQLGGENRMDELCQELSDAIPSSDRDEVVSHLTRAKNEFTLHWSWCFFSTSLDSIALGRWQSRFAQIAIDFALRHSWRTILGKHRIQSHDDDSHQGLFILGMGKLGGEDLNFSSDVDLVAFFDPQILPIPESLGQGYICHRLLQYLSQILAGNSKSNLLWRLDWRLRPNASATSLAMSSEVAIDYYFYRASPWHRLALMKSRVVAGDVDSGNRFLQQLEPFIWRQNLDYRALDELADIKRKINLEHPGLRVERKWQQAIGDDVRGFNLKLGSGGIREIEFVVNALQLLWGGKHRRLRTTNTLKALAQLSQLDMLGDSDARALRSAYMFLRGAENALQMSENLQTHSLPTTDSTRENFLRLVNEENWQIFRARLNRHRQRVHTLFSSLLQADNSEEVASAYRWPESLNDASKAIVEKWDKGFIAYGVSLERRSKMQKLAASLAKYLADYPAEDVDAVIARLDEYFKSLPRGDQYFRLLVESPALLEQIVQPIMHSPAMTILLQQSPHIIDCYMQARWDYKEHAFDGSFVVETEGYELQLERLRRFVNEHIYQLYGFFLSGEIAPYLLQKKLTGLAEYTLDLAVELVAAEINMPKESLAILAMGKLGMQKMGPKSDLDLIFLFHPEQCQMNEVSRFVSRLQTAISTPMREGVVYDLDTRLRPSGRSGSPIVSISSFENHQLNQARSWEHIALLPGRLITRQTEIDQRFQAIKRTVLTETRDMHQFGCDAKKMWHRLVDHRIKTIADDKMLSKLRSGGLLQAEYLLSCLILENGGQASTLDYSELAQQCLHSIEQKELLDAVDYWRVLYMWEQILGLSGQSTSMIPKRYHNTICEHLRLDRIEQIGEKNAYYAELVERQAEKFFQRNCERNCDKDIDLDSWHETAVRWQSHADHN